MNSCLCSSQHCRWNWLCGRWHSKAVCNYLWKQTNRTTDRPGSNTWFCIKSTMVLTSARNSPGLVSLSRYRLIAALALSAATCDYRGEQDLWRRIVLWGCLHSSPHTWWGLGLATHMHAMYVSSQLPLALFSGRRRNGLETYASSNCYFCCQKVIKFAIAVMYTVWTRGSCQMISPMAWEQG